MINENEERFFASESLQGSLTPEMLEGRNTSLNCFALIVGEDAYELHAYDESPAGLTMIFNCNTNMLAAILDIDTSNVNLRCGKKIITRDLLRYETSCDIIKVGTSNYKVTLSFEKPQTGIING